MKLANKEKAWIYHEWKDQNKSPEKIAKEWRMASYRIRYMVQLADQHGIMALKHKWTCYSPEFKKKTVHRVLIGHESAYAVSLDLEISNQGTLVRWIKEYIADGYVVIERIKGKKPHGKKEVQECKSD